MSDRELAERRGEVDAQLDDHSGTLVDHEERIGSLERFKWMVVGALLLLSSLLGVVSLNLMLGSI